MCTCSSTVAIVWSRPTLGKFIRCIRIGLKKSEGPIFLAVMLPMFSKWPKIKIRLIFYLPAFISRRKEREKARNLGKPQKKCFDFFIRCLLTHVARIKSAMVLFDSYQWFWRAMRQSTIFLLSFFLHEILKQTYNLSQKSENRSSLISFRKSDLMLCALLRFSFIISGLLCVHCMLLWFCF